VDQLRLGLRPRPAERHSHHALYHRDPQEAPRRQNKARVAAGENWIDADLVFTGPDGSALDTACVTDQFQDLIREADVPPIRLHDLRHFAATLMLAAGVDIKVVQETRGTPTPPSPATPTPRYSPSSNTPQSTPPPSWPEPAPSAERNRPDPAAWRYC
jgi:hypothetical protein